MFKELHESGLCSEKCESGEMSALYRGETEKAGTVKMKDGEWVFSLASETSVSHIGVPEFGSWHEALTQGVGDRSDSSNDWVPTFLLENLDCIPGSQPWPWWVLGAVKQQVNSLSVSVPSMEITTSKN